MDDHNHHHHHTSFSELLLGDNNVDHLLHLPPQHSSSSIFSIPDTTPTMLCFADHPPPTKSSESSSASSSCTNHKKRSGLASGGRRQTKKTRPDIPAFTGHAKRKEKLGERIAALQQLVSPFGKTDTASVLHEAMGYIRFLHDQVQVLCSPYLQSQSSSPHHQMDEGDMKGKEANIDLRSRGLCLIPVESTVHVASSNGADFWSPAMGNINNKI